jgi:thiamine-monophosphate kinase
VSSDRLHDIGERRLISEHLAPRYDTHGTFGDDCAVVSPALTGYELVATTDPCPTPLVYSLGWDDLYYGGWLLATINLSDLAAAGAEPLGLMTSYVLPHTLPVDDFERLLAGVDDCCARHGTEVVGGNIGDGPSVHLTATAMGRCPRGQRVSRRGAAAGDALVLIGDPGHLWATALVRLEHATLDERDAASVFDRALRPVAQTAAARALARTGQMRAAVDVSDGLYASVKSLCDSNGLGARIDRRVRLDSRVAGVCRQAGVDPFDLAQLWGDWTLLVATQPGAVDLVCELASEAGSPAQQVGCLTADRSIVLDGPGRLEPWEGYDQERFVSSSWHPDGLDGYLDRLLRRRAGL